MNDLIINAILIGALAVATITDLRARRIPNALTFGTFAAGFVLSTFTGGFDGLRSGAQGAGLARDRRRGDALVEFVLLAPILLLILFGIFEVARVVDAWLVVENAAREGARAGAVAYPDIAVAPAAQNAAKTYLKTSGLSNRAD